jgi:hypothetical protein
MYPKNFTRQPLKAASLGNGCSINFNALREMVPKPTENHNEFHSDDIDLVRRVMEDMFTLLLFDEQACDRIGFTKISPVIGKMPGWYLWTRDRKGAYYLHLIATEPTDAKSDAMRLYPNKRVVWIASDLILRYYPSPEESLFDEYAFVERQVRLGPCFDHIGTPFFDKQDSIHKSFFVVGTLHLAFDRGLNFARLGISSQDRWVEILKGGPVVRTDYRRTIEVLPEGSVMRNVPGWELSWCFFDKLLLGFCYVHKCCPIALRLSKSPGVAYYIDTNGVAIEVQDTTIHEWTLGTGIFLQSGQELSNSMTSLRKIFMASLQYSPEDDEFLVDYLEGPPESEHPWIDPAWWSASSWVLPSCLERMH